MAKVHHVNWSKLTASASCWLCGAFTVDSYAGQQITVQRDDERWIRLANGWIYALDAERDAIVDRDEEAVEVHSRHDAHEHRE